MKKITLFTTVLFASASFAQNNPINFETGGYGANWNWNVFENSTNTTLEFVTNPSISGINTSSTVAKFTALQAGKPWAGTESVHGANLGSFVLSSSNSVIKIMVYKSVISDVGIKLAAPKGWAQVEIKHPNTKINEWEELTFDFSSYTNPPASEGALDQIIVFPDFNARTQDNIVYFDNITFNNASSVPSSVPTVGAPIPTPLPADVISVFSNSYTNITPVDYNPGWGQSTVATQVLIAGNNTLKYAGLSYQGTDFKTIPQDVSANTGFKYVHFDYWTADATALQFFLINHPAAYSEKAFDVVADGGGIVKNEWKSVEIPLSFYTNAGLALNEIFQFKVVGNGTLYLDNLYFSKTSSLAVSDLKVNASKLQIYPNPVNSGEEIFVKSNVKSIEIYNFSGQLLKSSNAKNLSSKGLKTGIYLMKLTDENGNVQAGKLIVK